MSIAPINDAVYTAIGDFINYAVSGVGEVVRGLDNRVPMPRDPFVCMTPGSNAKLSWPVRQYDRSGAGSQSFKQPMRYAVNVDFYGPNSHDWALQFATLFFTDVAFDKMGVDVKPLYADDPIQLPLINGEQQFEERWLVVAHVQYNPIVSTPQEFAEALEINLIEVDSTFPAGA